MLKYLLAAFLLLLSTTVNAYKLNSELFAPAKPENSINNMKFRHDIETGRANFQSETRNFKNNVKSFKKQIEADKRNIFKEK